MTCARFTRLNSSHRVLWGRKELIIYINAEVFSGCACANFGLFIRRRRARVFSDTWDSVLIRSGRVRYRKE